LRPPAAQSALQRRQDGLALYRVWRRVGLSAIRAEGTALTLILVGLVTCLGGCGVSRNDGPFAKMTAKDVTSSIGPASEPVPTESDLAFARNAASDVLTKGDKDSSQPWTNPETISGWSRKKSLRTAQTSAMRWFAVPVVTTRRVLFILSVML